MNSDWYESLDWFKKTQKIKKVLFVCSGNTCRSPAAQYYFKEQTHWWDGLSSFSRGTEVNALLASLRARGIDIKSLMVEPESKKVMGYDEASFLSKHEAQQISAEDVAKADIVLTMEKKVRDLLRGEYPESSYKIFTLKGFVEANDDTSASLDIGNPFLPPPIRKKDGIDAGKKKYYLYLKNYAEIFVLIKTYVRRLVEILYILKEQK